MEGFSHSKQLPLYASKQRTMADVGGNVANLEIVCAGNVKCAYGPWRGDELGGWCDMRNIMQPWGHKTGDPCSFFRPAQDAKEIRHTSSNRQRDAMPAPGEYGGVDDGMGHIISDADPGL
jgi:hypothetical protein